MTTNTDWKREFEAGQLVQLDWEKLAEIIDYLPSGYYRVWVEQDGKGTFAVVHPKRIDTI